MTLSETLTARGFVHQHSAEKLSDITDGEPRTLYLGVDPTADSIHAGNLAGYMLLRHFKDAGHTVILIIGGGTGMIGDPKPDVERPLTPPEVIAERVLKIKAQAQQLLGGEVTLINNHDWLGSLNLIDFLRDTGKHFTVNSLMKKDAIAERLKGEEGISYTEFAYPLLQAYDFWHLYKTKNCTLQIGGSDQWGNIVAGVELIRRKEGAEAHALTLPLVTDPETGKKFGKSEGNAVWLDPQKTSPFQFYQFWVNASDEGVAKYLRLFTLFSLEEIEAIEAEHAADKGKRVAQVKLAYAVTELVHGRMNANAVQRVSEIMFAGTPLADITPIERDMISATAPKHHTSVGTILVDELVASGLAQSKREAREFVEGGAVTINGEKVTDASTVLESTHFVGGLSLVKRGKKQVALFAL